MLSLYYNRLSYAEVTDIADFVKSGLPEVTKVKSIMDNLKILLSLPQDRIALTVSEEGRVYKIYMLTPDVDKDVFGIVVYMPLENRLDLYGVNSNYPIIQWKNKKPEFKSYEMLLDRAGLEKIFSKIINAT